MIKVSHLSKSFNGQRILQDINLEISSGEMVVVLGESGTGKSVLLKHLMGLLKPDSGQVFIDGEDITQLSEERLLGIRQKIGYLFQEGALYDFMTVFENIAFPLKEHTRFDRITIQTKVKAVLKTVDLEGVGHKYPAELSGGMKKRVGLARAIILDSKILFCDEPTSGLDPIRSRDISDLIRSVAKQKGSTTVITSHDMANSFRIADRLVLIKEGKIVLDGTKEDFEKSKNGFVKEFIS
ncbi:Phospholipid ABC transporter ATP-binding protein MlaF [hydrothermal vent metagenome]|uniref:Phospholipid ABC transporter ATP-binding protein MlaF n=1 Tax=hydrothermal vent metagenome TaxID=652676 RepID=A0A3B1D5Z1_9ZZZZ